VVAVIGDSTFLHGGLPSLISAVYNQVPTTTILLDNRTTGMTGHQQHPGTGHTLQCQQAPAVDYETLARSVGVQHVEVVDPWDMSETGRAIDAGLAHPGPSLIIARRACMLLPLEKSRERTPYRVEADQCLQCEECLQTGCPALVREDDFPVVREWECTGCSLCAQLCPSSPCRRPETMSVTNVLVAGVGGQGAVLASELLALAALEAGHDVKQGEFHGVAQRGGAVFSHVRFGERVHSPMARLGSVDHLLSLELLEALRYAHHLKPGGTVLVNEHRVEPIRMADERPYPDEALEFLAGKALDVVPIKATELAIELGNHRAASAVMLGALSTRLEIPETAWQATLRARIPEALLQLNVDAFSAGVRAVTEGAATRG
jgi:indolepyruvate ferredoxin oxidoreductase beta subunit